MKKFPRILACVLCLSSCFGRNTPENLNAPGGPLDSAPSGGRPVDDNTGAAIDSVSVTDDEGNTISFDKPFARIISFYSAHTENLFALGAGASLIGGHSTCNYPAPAKELPVFEYTGDPEYVIAASPDLVLIRPFIRRRNPAYISALENAGIPVISLYPESLKDFDDYIRRLALLAGADAEQKLNEFHTRLQNIEAKSAEIKNKLNVFFETTERETRTASPESLPILAIEISGGVNIARDAKPVNQLSSIAPYGAEKLLSQAENIDAYIIQTGAMNPSNSIDALRKRPGFSTIKAIRGGKVLFIDEKIISSPVFRYLHGVKTIAHFLYPDEFDEPEALE
ncbi:MAG: ABC transporter substrate-binding protein [Spirochaetaceae bacterium]|jgi:iron complex transport system substrate-binding protein|nr:ABC transporter substrate-binding protein [Spirochaetaceae bacterium]